jgi:RNA polymerase sigma-70 factor, ECF subfamily
MGEMTHPNSGIREQLADLGPGLLKYARSLTPSAADAEDLAQETMARALRFQERFEPGTDARAWLYTICHRLQQQNWRNQKTRPQSFPLPGMQPDEDPTDIALVSPLAVEPSVMRRFEHREVVRAFARLGQEHQKVLRLYAVEDRSYEEIATKLDIPIGTVMSRIFRARRNLVRSLLEEGVL